MTCIVGIARDGNAWLGSDSGAWINDVVHILADSKVFAKGEFLFGYCGYRRLGDLLRHAFIPPAIENENLDEYASCEFADALRRTFKDKGYLNTNNGVESFEGRIMFALRAQIFYCDPNFAIHRPAENYLAMGCGEFAALAVLDVCNDLSPQKRLQLALETATRRVDGVRPPYHFVSTEKEQTA